MTTLRDVRAGRCQRRCRAPRTDWPAWRSPDPARDVRGLSSPLGPILIGRSEHGVSSFEYLDRGGVAGSRLARESGLEVEENAGDLERLVPRASGLSRGPPHPPELAASTPAGEERLHREVLRATAAVPYGSVTSYSEIAGAIGQRARCAPWPRRSASNPIPIVVPCRSHHRRKRSPHGLRGESGRPQRAAARGRGRAHGRVSRCRESAPQALYDYEANDAHEYCVPELRVDRRRPIGRVTLIASRERAGALGLVPCATCRPDLHRCLAHSTARRRTAPFARRFTRASAMGFLMRGDMRHDDGREARIMFVVGLSS